MNRPGVDGGELVQGGRVALPRGAAARVPDVESDALQLYFLGGDARRGAVSTGWSIERRALALVAFVGVVLLIAWLFYRADHRALARRGGRDLAAGLCATVYWMLVDQSRRRHAERHGARTGSRSCCSRGILAMGMSWSHVRRIWAGQTDVDEVDHR